MQEAAPPCRDSEIELQTRIKFRLDKAVNISTTADRWDVGGLIESKEGQKWRGSIDKVESSHRNEAVGIGHEERDFYQISTSLLHCGIILT